MKKKPTLVNYIKWHGCQLTGFYREKENRTTLFSSQSQNHSKDCKSAGHFKKCRQLARCWISVCPQEYCEFVVKFIPVHRTIQALISPLQAKWWTSGGIFAYGWIYLDGYKKCLLGRLGDWNPLLIYRTSTALTETTLAASVPQPFSRESSFREWDSGSVRYIPSSASYLRRLVNVPINATCGDRLGLITR